MKAYGRDKTREDRRPLRADTRQRGSDGATFVDRRPEAAVQRQQIDIMRDGAGATPPIGEIADSPRVLAQRMQLDRTFGARAPNRTGMPDPLKNGVESLSGMDVSDVRVHRNSAKPARINALAYTLGNEIHLGPGQEEHLPHEAWHVVQQRRGQVKPTMQLAGVNINDDRGLEDEADTMGARAAQMRVEPAAGQLMASGARGAEQKATPPLVIQRQLWVDVKRLHNVELEQSSSDDLDYKDIIMSEYARLMADDRKAIVKPKKSVSPNQKEDAIKECLEATPIDREELVEAFASLLVQGNDWLEVEEDPDTLKGLKANIQECLDYNQQGAYNVVKDQATWSDVSRSPDDYGIENAINDIVKKQIKTNETEVTEVSQLNGFAKKYSDPWRTCLAFAAYEVTKGLFYPPDDNFVVPVLPFIRLITDINEGRVTALLFVDRYPTTSGPGAEFTVQAPDAKRDDYDGRAVVHTHYASKESQPHYGHTKPTARKEARGYGYTKVNLDRLLNMNDTKKTWNDLK